jgi:Holliday junction resolvase RusA-like endonuclease
MKLTLPLPPNRANARGHWAVQRKARKAYCLKALVAIRNQYGPLPIAGGASLSQNARRVTATLYVRNLMDDDNATALLKWVLDTLVHAGLLVDDKQPWCTLTGIPQQVLERRKPRVELELEPV